MSFLIASHTPRACLRGTSSRTERAHPRPAASDSIFISIIVKAPIVQLISMFLAISIILFDYPAPFIKGSAIHRSFPIRIVLLLLQTFFSILYYQVCYPFMTLSFATCVLTTFPRHR